VKPAVLFAILGLYNFVFGTKVCSCSRPFEAIWEYRSSHHDNLPDNIQHASELQTIANRLLANADVNKQVITTMPQDLIEFVDIIGLQDQLIHTPLAFRMMATTAAHEFSPVCAVVGGMLAQDILKALAAREPPIANFFTFDGNGGGGTVCRLNMA
jgi:ubiquitin-like 1-activating enzyme E1 A